MFNLLHCIKIHGVQKKGRSVIVRKVEEEKEVVVVRKLAVKPRYSDCNRKVESEEIFKKDQVKN